MNMRVVPEADSGFDYDSEGPLPVPPGRIEATDTSDLGQLRQRLTKAKEERTLVRWVLPPTETEPGIVVEYRPIDWEELESIRAAHKKAGKKQGILAGTDILVLCCLGIYTAHEAPERRELWEPLTDDDPTTFSSTALGRFLSDPDKGLEVRTARQCVRNLYATDGDVMAVGDEVVKFSGYLGEDEANRPN